MRRGGFRPLSDVETRQVERTGITLLEVLVAVGVIALLVALIVPAIQSARETARRVQCRNNLKQVGIAVMSHEATHRHFPSNGWGYLWVGDPDRGYGPRQPGGWIYQLLPQMDATAIATIGGGLTGIEKEDALSVLLASPLPVFKCPSRPGAPLQLARPEYPRNATWTPFVVKTDYAINEGDYITDTRQGPATVAEGDNPRYVWTDVKKASGISFLRSEVRAADVRDGLSQTYLAGEKYVRTDSYESSADLGHDQSLYSGVDLDINRWTIDPPLRDSTADTHRRFGSAHAGGCHFVMCDGAVHFVAYSIDRDVHRSLGHRSDGGPREAL